MKTKVIVGLLILGGIMACAWCVWGFASSPYSPLFWAVTPRQKIQVLVPKDYEGSILIGYQVPDGVMAERQGDILVYHIPEEGVLMLKDDPPNSIIQMRFYYVELDAPLIPIPESACWDSSPEKVIFCVGGEMGIHNAKEMRPNMSYCILGKIANEKKCGDEYFKQLDLYTYRLALPK